MAGKSNNEEAVVVSTAKPEKVPYMIPISPDPNEDEYVYGSVNMKNIRVKRGETVLLPTSFVEMFENSFKETNRAYQKAKREHEETVAKFSNIKLG